MKKCLLTILLSIVFMVLISYVNSEEIKNKENWVSIADFNIGFNNNEIPNTDEGADLYYSPRNFFIDGSGNFYVFILGKNEIKKFSFKGKYEKSLSLEKFDNNPFSAVYVHKEKERIYALTETKIHVFDHNFNQLYKIDIGKLVSKEKIYLENIRVIGDDIYVYWGPNKEFYIIKERNASQNIDNYKKDTYVFNNTFLYKVQNDLSLNNEKKVLNYFDSAKKQKQFILPNDSNVARILNCTNSSLFILLQNPSRDSLKIVNKIMIINIKKENSYLNLKESSRIYASNLPLIDFDNKENVYYLCLVDNKFVIYCHKTQ